MSTESFSFIFFFSQWKCLKFRTYFNENTFSPSSYNNNLQFCSLQLLRYQGTTASCSLGFRFLCSSKCGVLLRHIPCEESSGSFRGWSPCLLTLRFALAKVSVNFRTMGCFPSKLLSFTFILALVLFCTFYSGIICQGIDWICNYLKLKVKIFIYNFWIKNGST